MTTTAQSSVLAALRNANHDNLLGLSIHVLSIMTGYPEASIRRTIAELKNNGTIIAREGRLVRLVA